MTEFASSCSCTSNHDTLFTHAHTLSVNLGSQTQILALDIGAYNINITNKNPKICHLLRKWKGRLAFMNTMNCD